MQWPFWDTADLPGYTSAWLKHMKYKKIVWTFTYLNVKLYYIEKTRQKIK